MVVVVVRKMMVLCMAASRKACSHFSLVGVFVASLFFQSGGASSMSNSAPFSSIKLGCWAGGVYILYEIFYFVKKERLC
jgi:hypothetical protein